MRQLVGYTAALLLLSAVAGLGWALHSKIHRQRTLIQRVSSLPSFAARSLEGTRLAVPQRGPLILLYFSPTCDLCQHEAAELRQHLPELGSTQVWWLATDSLPALQAFAQQQRLLHQPHMQVVQVKPAVVTETFGFATVPSTLTYNASGRLVHRFKGEVSVGALLQGLDRPQPARR